MGFRVWGLGFGDWGLGLEFRVWGLELGGNRGVSQGMDRQIGQDPCRGLHPTFYTLHPVPYTLHPTPSTLGLGENRGVSEGVKRQIGQDPCRDRGHAGLVGFGVLGFRVKGVGSRAQGLGFRV